MLTIYLKILDSYIYIFMWLNLIYLDGLFCLTVEKTNPFNSLFNHVNQIGKFNKIIL